MCDGQRTEGGHIQCGMHVLKIEFGNRSADAATGVVDDKVRRCPRLVQVLEQRATLAASAALQAWAFAPVSAQSPSSFPGDLAASDTL